MSQEYAKEGGSELSKCHCVDRDGSVTKREELEEMVLGSGSLQASQNP